MKRIKRVVGKGIFLPSNSKYVGPPTKWATPFKDEKSSVLVDVSHRFDIPSRWAYLCDHSDGLKALDVFERLLKDPNDIAISVEPIIRERFQVMRENVEEIKGLDLACYCDLNQPCHADVLLRFLERN